MFDVSTLIMTTVILVLLMTSVVAVAWRIAPGMPGIRLWFQSYLAISIGLFLLGLRGTLPPLLPIVVGNAFLLGSALANYSAIRQYVGVPPFRLRWAAVVLAGFAGAMALFTYVYPNVPARILVFSAISGTVYLCTARVATHRGLAGYPGRLFFVALSALHGTFLWLRFGVVAWQRAVGDDLAARASWVQQATFLEALIAVVMFALAIALLAGEHQSEKLRRLSEMDSLTEVFNRRAFLALFDKALSRARRDGQPLSVLAIDLDRFKQVNDTFGHAVGDDVLRHFTELTETKLRGEDVLGRIGGEEFAVLLPGMTADGAAQVAERLRGACERSTVTSGGGEIRFTVSIGIAQTRPEEGGADALRRADEALYKAKTEGRNRVVG